MERPGPAARAALRRLGRTSGLRARILLALLASSVVTLVVAALTLLSPLQERLRSQSEAGLRTAVLTARPQLEAAIRRDRDRIGGSASRALSELAAQTNAQVIGTNSIPRVIYGFQAPGDRLDDVFEVMATDATVVSRQEDLLRVAVPLYPEPVRGVPRPRDRPGPFFTVAVRQTDTNAAEAVTEVRRALLIAGGLSFGVAVLLGLVLSSTLTRRLQRLRQSAARITREGMDAPAPHDVARDEVGDLARALAAMQGALRRQERARRAFVSTASHELRTPITSLSGTLELLGEDLEDGHLDQEDARRQVTAAQRELGRLRNLATELLDLSRLDAGVALRSEPVELGEVARAVAAEFAIQDRDRGGGLRFVPPRGPCWAKGDPDAVARVVRILIDNALRYSPPGTPIRVEAAYDGSHATLAVADEGPGIPEPERAEIFERFRRGRAASGAGGFGLGLAIGRELAERLGGRLDLAPTARGARFVLSLPIELPAGSHAPAPQPAAAG